MTKQDTETGALVKQGLFPSAERLSFFRRNVVARLAENPVILKELRGRMRGKRSFVLLTTYLGLISLIIGVMYLILSQESSYTQWDPEYRQIVGKAIFSAVVLVELLMITFLGPALTAGAITAEREKQTFDLLRTTLLSGRALVLGKLGSALTYLLLLVFTAVPIESLAFILGGVGLGELLVSSLMLVVTALFFCSLGLFFSSFVKRTLAATVSSYATILVSSMLLGLCLFVITYFMNTMYNVTPFISEEILNILLWIMVSTNPLLTAILSEVMLVENQSLFFSNSIFGSNLWLPSPWILFTIIYLTMTVLLIFLSIHYVNRQDR